MKRQTNRELVGRLLKTIERIGRKEFSEMVDADIRARAINATSRVALPSVPKSERLRLRALLIKEWSKPIPLTDPELFRE